MSKKLGFTVYYDWIEPLSRIPEVEFKTFLLSLIAYEQGELYDIPKFNSMEAQLSSMFMFPQIDRAKKNASNGSKGGERTQEKKNASTDGTTNGLTDGLTDGTSTNTYTYTNTYTNTLTNTLTNTNNAHSQSNSQMCEEDTESITYIIEYLNQRANSNYRVNNQKTRNLIKTRMGEGHSEGDFLTVIDKMCDSWIGADKEQYLRPQTLFGTKFESYLNAKINTQPNNKNTESTFDYFMNKLQDCYNKEE